jgi:hypothetical protein
LGDQKKRWNVVEPDPNIGEVVEYVVYAAWECENCDVAGWTPPGGAVECWSCGGPVVVTARPAIRRVVE